MKLGDIQLGMFASLAQEHDNTIIFERLNIHGIKDEVVVACGQCCRLLHAQKVQLTLTKSQYDVLLTNQEVFE